MFSDFCSQVFCMVASNHGLHHSNHDKPQPSSSLNLRVQRISHLMIFLGFILLVQHIDCHKIDNDKSVKSSIVTIETSTVINQAQTESEISTTNCVTSTKSPSDEEEEEVEEESLFSLMLPKDYSFLSEKMYEWKSIDNRFKNINDTIEVLERLIQHGQFLFGNNDRLMDARHDLLLAVIKQINNSKTSMMCLLDLLKLTGAVNDKELWPWKFLDASGHIWPTGLLQGITASLGDYDECLSIKSPALRNDQHIYGQYCQAQFHGILPPEYDPKFENEFSQNFSSFSSIFQWFKTNSLGKFLEKNFIRKFHELTRFTNDRYYRLGVCLPNRCSPNDIEELLNAILYPLFKIPVKVDYCDVHSDIQPGNNLNVLQWTSITILTIACLLIIGSSLKSFCFDEKTEIFSNSTLIFGPDDSEMKSPSRKVSLIIQNFLKIFSATNGEHTSSETPSTSFFQAGLTQNTVQSSNSKVKESVEDQSFLILDFFSTISTVLLFLVQASVFQLMLTWPMIKNLSKITGMISNRFHWFVPFINIPIDLLSFNLGFTAFWTIHKMWCRFVLETTLNSQSQEDPSKMRPKRMCNIFYFVLFYLFKQWFRMTMLLFGSFLVIYLFPLLGDGPMWPVNDQWLMPSCYDPGLIVSSFLFFSNFNSLIFGYRLEGPFLICNPPTWLLSMSMQLIALGMVVIGILLIGEWGKPKKYYKIYFSQIFLLSFFCLVFPFLVKKPHYLSWSQAESFSDMIRGLTFYLMNPGQYLFAFSMGSLVCSILVKQNLSPKQGPRQQRKIDWSISFTTGSITPKTRTFQGKHKLPNKTQSVLFWVLAFGAFVSGLGWSLALWQVNNNTTVSSLELYTWWIVNKVLPICSIAFLCHQYFERKTEFLRTILQNGQSIFRPVAKHSMTILVMSTPVLLYRYTSVRHQYELYQMQMVQNLFIDFLITVVLSHLLHLLILKPSQKLIQLYQEEIFSFKAAKKSLDLPVIQRSSHHSNNNNNQDDEDDETKPINQPRLIIDIENEIERD